jgi:hypothetical protein
LLNFLKTTDAIDREKLIPCTAQIAGKEFILGYRKMFLKENLRMTECQKKALKAAAAPYIARLNVALNMARSSVEKNGQNLETSTFSIGVP